MRTSCINISSYFYKLHRSIDVFDTILSLNVANDFAFLEGRYFLFVNSSVCVFVLFVGWLASQIPFLLRPAARGTKS